MEYQIYFRKGLKGERPKGKGEKAKGERPKLKDQRGKPSTKFLKFFSTTISLLLVCFSFAVFAFLLGFSIVPLYLGFRL
ncbi:hypothetical protein DHW03_01370 [Pedobacter yonginense]|uniref:Uncharacterized protein n=1 Tax=Pedobacter yonginense TaxID=651869 RepID=A0A317EQ89_9SPHI|nr:hypothetical protein DHW03_01370 [Pedobacter yonginense]